MNRSCDLKYIIEAYISSPVINMVMNSSKGSKSQRTKSFNNLNRIRALTIEYYVQVCFHSVHPSEFEIELQNRD